MFLKLKLVLFHFYVQFIVNRTRKCQWKWERALQAMPNEPFQYVARFYTINKSELNIGSTLQPHKVRCMMGYKLQLKQGAIFKMCCICCIFCTLIKLTYAFHTEIVAWKYLKWYVSQNIFHFMVKLWCICFPTFKPPADSPIQCSSPHIGSPAGDEISTPRINRRISSSSTSPPGSIPEDKGTVEVVEEYNDQPSTSRHSHSNNQHQHSRPPPSVRSQPRSESRCSQCSHCTGQDHYDAISRRQYREPNAFSADIDNYDDDDDDQEYGDYYGTLPARRGPKPPIIGVRQPSHSASKQRRSRRYLDPGPEDEDYYVNETSSEIYWGNRSGWVCKLMQFYHFRLHLI